MPDTLQIDLRRETVQDAAMCPSTRTGKPAARTAAAADSDHEARCRRCGQCCHEKLLVGEHVIQTDSPCAHLEPSARTCRVYAERYRRNIRCLTVAEGLAAGIFPADCPYVAGVRGYRAPVDGAAAREVLALIAASPVEDGEPVVDLEAVEAVIARHGVAPARTGRKGE